MLNFPGMCFASTRCATVEPGKTWELTPFCGRSTCMQSEKEPSKLLELVEDCGPLPLANEKCKLDTNKTNKTAPFPYCCPKFTCEPGVKLEYPEIAKEDPPKKD
uniref:Single domain-containing protein n=1 Tax=Glossina brevipalpis TaxID=37001 RepID=A0A1A9WQD5_9MUSC